MTPDLDAYVREAARALDLELDDARRAAVAAALAGILDMVAAFDAINLAPHDEPAPRFIP